MIKIDTKEFDRLSVDIYKMNDKINIKVQDVVKSTAFKIERGAKENLSNNGSVKTGHLRRSIATSLGTMEATVHTSNVKYSSMVEGGTKAHIIRPKNKKALFWKGASRPVKFVRHPGSKAKPYLIPAFEKEKLNFVSDLEKIIEW